MCTLVSYVYADSSHNTLTFIYSDSVLSYLHHSIYYQNLLAKGHRFVYFVIFAYIAREFHFSLHSVPFSFLI